ncbi:MAG: hypothetical protein VKK42_25945 [Lyngbya sp.]|nr:hypothetical protein [Lyngbya sp.]
MKSIRRFLLLIGLSGVMAMGCTSENSHRDLGSLTEVSSPIARTPASEPTPLTSPETSSATPTPTENAAPDIWEQMRQGIIRIKLFFDGFDLGAGASNLQQLVVLLFDDVELLLRAG